MKSILYTKLLLAVNQDIEVNIDIPDEIDSVNMDPVDLTRMLGIYLDNAIEACLETKRPILNFHLGKLNQDIVFIISNTFVDKGLSVAQMHKKDVTTKGEGLWQNHKSYKSRFLFQGFPITPVQSRTVYR